MPHHVLGATYEHFVFQEKCVHLPQGVVWAQEHLGSDEPRQGYVDVTRRPERAVSLSASPNLGPSSGCQNVKLKLCNLPQLKVCL